MNERDTKPAPSTVGSVEQDRIVLLSDGIDLAIKLLIFCFRNKPADSVGNHSLLIISLSPLPLPQLSVRLIPCHSHEQQRD